MDEPLADPGFGARAVGIPPAIWWSLKISAWCSCRPTRPNSIRSSGCGCISETIACRTVSFAPPMRSSTAVVTPGIGCSPKPAASARCAPIPGSDMSLINQVGIMSQMPARSPSRSNHVAGRIAPLLLSAGTAPRFAVRPEAWAPLPPIRCLSAAPRWVAMELYSAA